MTAPVWALASKCAICGIEFSLFKRRHHCRNCGNSICKPCEAPKLPIPKYGYLKPVLWCKKCHSQINPKERESLMSQAKGEPTVLKGAKKTLEIEKTLPPGVLAEGFLKKKLPQMRWGEDLWKLRYFVLERGDLLGAGSPKSAGSKKPQEPQIIYYESEKRKDQLGKIAIREVQAVWILAHENPARFNIVMEGDILFPLEAESALECEWWVRAIKSCLSTTRKSTQTLPASFKGKTDQVPPVSPSPTNSSHSIASESQGSPRKLELKEGGELYFKINKNPVVVTNKSSVEEMKKNLKELNDAYEREFMAMSNAYSKARRELQEWIDAKEHATFTVVKDTNKPISPTSGARLARNESIISRLDVEDYDLGDDNGDGDDDDDDEESLGISLPDADLLREQLDTQEEEEQQSKNKKKKKGHPKRNMVVIHSTPSDQKEFLYSEKHRDQQRYIGGFGRINTSPSTNTYNSKGFSIEKTSPRKDSPGIEKVSPRKDSPGGVAKVSPQKDSVSGQKKVPVSPRTDVEHSKSYLLALERVS